MKNSEDKAKAALQKRLNNTELICTKYWKALEARKRWIISANKLFEKLKKEGRISVEELKEYFPPNPSKNKISDDNPF